MFSEFLMFENQQPVELDKQTTDSGTVRLNRGKGGGANRLTIGRGPVRRHQHSATNRGRTQGADTVNATELPLSDYGS